ncbi:MAG: aminoglycoside phosphotransferase family protein [Gammaproteobacteria bacterium]|nr:aminoglycoside phosphotransferase family protein [Gammaproteobacteria bacterium]
MIQELWSGYGYILRVGIESTEPRAPQSIIVKSISPGTHNDHPRGWNSDHSNHRKIRSYAVEAAWYRHYSKDCEGVCRIPSLLAASESSMRSWLVLEDLDVLYPRRHSRLNARSVGPCLQWLACFHAQFLGHQGQHLWPVGTYWHLGTRQDEFAAMPDGPVKQAAEKLDSTLRGARYKTLVHGDAKVANVCFSRTGDAVAMVDFQYVGCGIGVQDVAYFLGSCLDEETYESCEALLLDFYFSALKERIADSVAMEVEAEWRALYPIACADFHRFLLGWMPTHPKINKCLEKTTYLALEALSLPVTRS